MMTDIVIPVYNKLDYTKNCISSIQRNTKINFRIIVIDDSSQDETKQYLSHLAGLNEITLLRNENNCGWLKSANKGLKFSDADYVCLMNNDTLVTEGWLEEMLNVAQKEEDIGLVNPSSNTFGVKIPRGETLDSFAKKLKIFSGEYKELDNCIGFCMLIKKIVISKIGYFDEIFSPGYWEESDYCRRAYLAGYRSVCAKGAYVFHYEQVTFKYKNNQIEKIKKRNWQIYYTRYKPSRIAIIVPKISNRKNFALNVLALARQGHLVYLFTKEKSNLEVKEHSNVRIYSVPICLFLIFFIKLWMRSKNKSFDILVFSIKSKILIFLKRFLLDNKIILADFSNLKFSELILEKINKRA